VTNLTFRVSILVRSARQRLALCVLREGLAFFRLRASSSSEEGALPIESYPAVNSTLLTLNAEVRWIGLVDF
jgi:hypothetical protein